MRDSMMRRHASLTDGADAGLRPDPLSLTSAQFVDAAKSRGISKNDALDAYRACHRRGEWADWCAEPPAPPHTQLVDERTVKFLMGVGRDERAGGDLESESVIIPMPHRGGRFSRTLCVSSQVGCAMGCAFCETGQMGLLRSLSVREIVQQLHAARFLVQHPFTNETKPEYGSFDIANIVFMGMGEPMDNLDAVLQAVRVMCDGNGPSIGCSRVTISTVGRIDGIRRLGEFIQQHGFRRVGLAVSLNAPNDEIRSRIMPINRSEPMPELLAAMRAFPKRPTSALCAEYVLIPGVNDALAHADQVCAALAGIRCSLNVIPYNPRRNSPWPAPDEATVDAFVARAISNGQFTKRRRTKGRTAMAACGQLGNERVRARKFTEVTTTPPASTRD
jgi:23S rRNA (adenine2503-C2)-methyltransferase